jgi:hypothetical protein
MPKARTIDADNRSEPGYAADLLDRPSGRHRAGSQHIGEDDTADSNIDWETCADGCAGIRLPTGGKCWAHAADDDLDAALKQLGGDGRLDARRVPITQELLERLLAAAPHDDHNHAILTDARFDEATFQGDAGFDEATFQGDARFDEATFQRNARFQGATFQRDAGFRGASFQATAEFDDATFRGGAWFGGATFQRNAGFRDATFQRNAWFDDATFPRDARFVGATFQSYARFVGATFQGDAEFNVASFQATVEFRGATFRGNIWFQGATFQRDAGFRGASFQGDAEFGGASFRRDARFEEATFQRARQLGPMLVRKSLVLNQAVFHERAQIEVAAAAVCCRHAKFRAGVQLRVRWAQVMLGDADMVAPSILTGAPDPFPGLDDESRWARALERLQRLERGDPRGSRPRLVSVGRADVAGLTVAGVDLRACRFAGAHHLDQLRVEESDFGVTPSGWRWATRQTIAEEHHWRAAHPHADRQHPTPATATPRTTGRGKGWYQPAHRPPAWLDVQPPTSAQVAALYRALRKGREDSKDEPGAADFYYGEMEMRRHARRERAEEERRGRHYRHWTAATTEGAVLWLYWLVSGYGLRAWRALAALTVMIGLVGVGFSRVGFHHPHPSQAASWLYALQATVSLEGKARQLSGQLTLPGELLRVGLRFTGPVLLGLALLSIRGRVKR